MLRVDWRPAGVDFNLASEIIETSLIAWYIYKLLVNSVPAGRLATTTCCLLYLHPLFCPRPTDKQWSELGSNPVRTERTTGPLLPLSPLQSSLPCHLFSFLSMRLVVFSILGSKLRLSLSRLAWIMMFGRNAKTKRKNQSVLRMCLKRMKTSYPNKENGW